MAAENLKHFFYLGQMAIGAAFLVLAWILFRPKTPDSNFRVREADQRRTFPKPGSKQAEQLAQAKLKQQERLRLPGIRIDGRPYEILGVSPNATLAEIQSAYRNLMKTYHPDRVGAPGSREWTDAQKIAEAINRAKNEMIERLKKRV